MDLNALLYPATFPRRHTARRLSQVFDRLTVLLPAENLTVTHFDDLPIDTIVPAPLEGRLSWFDRLIKDWKAWARETGLGTGVTAQVLLKTWKHGSAESLEEIMASLSGKDVSDPLIEARILLRLAHEIDEEDDRLDLELASVSRLEKDLRASLQGESADEGLPRDAGLPSIPPLDRPGPRIRAWNEIACRAELNELLPVGEGMDVKDLLDRAYEDLVPGSFPHDLMRIRLPLALDVRPMDEPDIRKTFVSLVHSLIEKGEETPEAAFDLEKRLSDLSRIHGEGPEFRLTVYSKRSFQEVLSRAAGRPWKKAETPQTGFSFFLM